MTAARLTATELIAEAHTAHDGRKTLPLQLQDVADALAHARITDTEAVSDAEYQPSENVNSLAPDAASAEEAEEQEETIDTTTTAASATPAPAVEAPAPAPAVVAQAPARVRPDAKWARLEGQFQRLTQQLTLTAKPDVTARLGIASSVRGEGRTTVALGLATTLVKVSPSPVVLIEADLGHPTIAHDLGLPNAGLSEYLRGETEWDSILQPTALSDLMVIVAGDCRGKSMEALRSDRLTTLIDMLSEHFGTIIVDMPPLSIIGEATRVLNQVEQVIMVVEAHRSPTKVVQRSLDLIPQSKIAGILLNRTRPAFDPLSWLRRLVG